MSKKPLPSKNKYKLSKPNYPGLQISFSQFEHIFWWKCVFWHVEDLSWEISCVNVKRDKITLQKTGKGRSKTEKGRPRFWKAVLARPVPWQDFELVPVVPLSRDNEGTSVSLSRKVALSLPIRNSTIGIDWLITQLQTLP